MSLAVTFAHTHTARTIETNGMHLIEIGHGTVAFGQIADVCNWRNVALYGVDALEGD